MPLRHHIAIALSLVLSAPPAMAQQTERYTLPATRSAVYNLVGEIQVQAGTGNEVVVEVIRGGRDAAALTLERGPVGDRETLRVVFPAEDIVYPRMSRGSNSNFRIRSDGTFGGGGDRGRGSRGRRGFDSDQVNVRGSGSGMEAYADLRISVPTGAEIAVYLGVGKAMISNVNGRISVDAASAPVTAQGVKGLLSIDVGSGSVEVTDAEADVNIDTGSGDVRVTGVKGRQLTIDTGSGEITATDLTVEGATVETGSGDVRLSGVHGTDLRFETGSGNIDAELATDVAALTIETGSGDVVLRVPDNLGATVDIETGSGGIESQMPLEVQRWGKDHVTGRIGDGQGRLAVETGSGDVKLIRIGAVAPTPR